MALMALFEELNNLIEQPPNGIEQPLGWPWGGGSLWHHGFRGITRTSA